MRLYKGKGEHGTKVYFVKQLLVTEGEGEGEKTRLIPTLREIDFGDFGNSLAQPGA